MWRKFDRSWSSMVKFDKCCSISWRSGSQCFVCFGVIRPKKHDLGRADAPPARWSSKTWSSRRGLSNEGFSRSIFHAQWRKVTQSRWQSGFFRAQQEFRPLHPRRDFCFLKDWVECGSWQRFISLKTITDGSRLSLWKRSITISHWRRLSASRFLRRFCETSRSCTMM